MEWSVKESIETLNYYENFATEDFSNLIDILIDKIKRR